MTKQVCRVFATAALVCAAGAAQTMPEYLDVYSVKIKPEKRMEFEAAARKIVEANRKNKGDRWIASTTEYGDQGTYYFTSARNDLASVETGSQAFMKAMTTAFGKAGMERIFADMDSASIYSRGEIRRRRPDLSANSPTSMEDLYKLIGSSRWLRTAKVDLKQGKTSDFIELWTPFKVALAKAAPDMTILVSQSMTGTPALYTTSYAKTMADFDRYNTETRAVLEDQAYRNFMAGLEGVSTSTRWEIYRLKPELSYPPDEIANVDPAYWHPKPATMPSKEKKTKGD